MTRREQLEQGGLSAEDADAILDAFAALIEPVSLRFLWRPRLKDPADEMVLETAVSGFADRIAMFNLRHIEEAAATFGFLQSGKGEILREIRGVKQ